MTATFYFHNTHCLLFRYRDKADSDSFQDRVTDTKAVHRLNHHHNHITENGQQEFCRRCFVYQQGWRNQSHHPQQMHHFLCTVRLTVL